MFYSEHRPSPALSAIVDRYWTLEGETDGGMERVLPDGHSEAVVNLGDVPRRELAGNLSPQPSALWIGQMENAVLLQPGRHVSIFGIRFRPHGAWACFGWPQAETCGKILALSDVWGSGWEERVGNVSTTVDRIQLTESWLLQRRVRQVHAAVAFASSEPLNRVEEVATEAGISSRQLQRLFQEQIGLTPKSFARVSRLQLSLRLHEQHPRWNWARIAAEAGYFDQPHLVADFRGITGEPPAGLVDELNPMARHLIRAER